MGVSLRRSDWLVVSGTSFAFLVGGAIVTRFFGAAAPLLVATAGLALVLCAAVAVFRRIEDRTEELRTQLEASFALNAALRPVEPLPPMRGFAMTPDSALAMYALMR